LLLLAAWFRLFVGDLSNDVSDDVLSNAFNKYTSFQKARVIRDRLSAKVGPCTRSSQCLRLIILDQAKYGFVAFSDPEDFLKAWKEMDGEHAPLTDKFLSLFTKSECRQVCWQQACETQESG
jgi:RNA recognition motif-containing protein